MKEQVTRITHTWLLIPPFSGRSSTDVYSWNCEKYTHLPYIEDTAPHLRAHQLYTQVSVLQSKVHNVKYTMFYIIDYIAPSSYNTWDILPTTASLLE